MHLNISSIKTKIDQLEIILNDKKIDVCCLSETFLKNDEAEILQVVSKKLLIILGKQNQGVESVFTLEI